MNQNSRNPISWVPTVYFAMGLPFVVLNMVSVLMFKGLGIGDAQIALWTSLIMLPWTLKFLWSPFLEMFKTKKFFVVLTQLITGAGFALVALALHLPAFFAVCIALLAVIAFSGATHDVATDGVYMSELNKQDQAKYIGWQGAFYNIAKIVASGGLVWLAGWLLKYFGGVQGAEEAVRHEATVQAWMMVMLVWYCWECITCVCCLREELQPQAQHPAGKLGTGWWKLSVLSFRRSISGIMWHLSFFIVWPRVLS